MKTADEILDHTPLLFGKHKGSTPSQVADIDPTWLIWAYETIHDKRICSRALYDACKEDAEDGFDEYLEDED